MKALITGAAGLVGSSTVELLQQDGWRVVGIDNYLRSTFFGNGASTAARALELIQKYPQYDHREFDLRDHRNYRDLPEVDLIVHAASQPSHDLAADIALIDFDVNARATMLLLEWYRRNCPDAVFVYLSTNKVYGDSINQYAFNEEPMRWEPQDLRLFMHGIDEDILSIDRSMHSLFGVSKLAGDLAVQEYGRYFNLKTVCFRCGCLTGLAHRGSPQHGFLAYLAKCVREKIVYTIIGYDGKQVRDNLHASDVARACLAVYHNMQERPLHGEVFNLGGGRARSLSVLQALTSFQDKMSSIIPVRYEPLPRAGDHIWWISDTTKFEEWSGWSPQMSIEDILEELANG